MKDFEALVSAVLPDIVALVPKEPAARLGRWKPKGRQQRGTRVYAALKEVGDLLSERLLGALELTVDRLVVDIPPDLVAGLTPVTATGFGMVGIVNEQTATKEPVAFVEKLHPGAADLVVELVEALRELASVPDATGDEADIAARHGAAHFALAVIVSTAVLRSLGTAVGAATPAIIGVALGAAAIVLPTVPKPPAYAAAVVDRTRVEYQMPRYSTEVATVAEHLFAITEGSQPEYVGFVVNGLVTAVPGGVAIRTGIATGHVTVSTDILNGPPDELGLSDWDDVVEISWTAPQGGAVMHGAGPKLGRQPRWQAPPWPGDYRVRVHVSGRDDDDAFYHLMIWQAPAAPEIVHKKTDRLGHRLRGEPEPPLVIPPDADYRWIEKGPLSAAATVTVIHGRTLDEVISTFGADPAAPVSIEETAGVPSRRLHGAPEQLLAVLAVDDMVLAVEDHGSHGADPDTLVTLSRKGKAVSLYWAGNAGFLLAIAERGKLSYAGDPRHDRGAPHTDDLDFGDRRHRNAKGLTVLARVAGRGVTADDVAAIYAADRAYILEK